LTKVDPFINALRRRVTLALRAGQTPATGTNPPPLTEASTLARLLAAVAAEMMRGHEMAARHSAFTILAQNRGGHSNPAEVDAVMNQLAGELRALTGGIQERLKDFAYPFPHARGAMSVAEYLRSEKAGEDEWHSIYLEASSHLDRLFTLHYRLLGRVLALADATEKNFAPVAPEGEAKQA
jgi:hypothetical protein